jgi:CHAT domain-containing protein
MRPHVCLLLLTVSLALCGCRFGGANMAMPDYVMASYEGNYDETIRLVEKRLADGNKPLPRYYVHLCDAYLQVKQYDKLFSCIDALERIMDEQGPYVFAGGDVDWHTTAADRGYVPKLLRAEAALDLARYDEAIAGADRTVRYLTGPDPWHERNKPSMFIVGSLESHLYKPYEVKGLACAAKKNAPCIDESIERIRKHKSGGSFDALAGDSLDEYLDSLARLYMIKGDYKSAVEVLTGPDNAKGFQALAGLFGGSSMFEHVVLPRQFMVGHALLMLGREADARQLIEPLLSQPAMRSMGNVWWMLLQDMARIESRQKQADKAVAHLAQAIDILESQRSTLHTEASKIGFVGDKQSVYRDIIALLAAQGRDAAAFEYAERGKSRTLVDLLAERQNIAPAAPDTDAGKALIQLASLERDSSRMVHRSDAESARLRSALGAARETLRRSDPELASLVSVSAASSEQIRSLLAPDETLLEYYVDGDEVYAFAVTRDGVQARRLDGKGLEADVRALRKEIGDAGRDGYRPIARALYDRLIGPVPGVLDRPRLLVVAHGALHYLPWSALMVDSGGVFLVDRVSLRLLPSASVMQYLSSRRSRAGREILVLGNPDLGDANYDLPGAEAEARAIKSIWPGAIVLTRSAATKSAFGGGRDFRMIHVAAHGLFESDQPLASRILLSPSGNDDGRLTAGDLYGIRLDAELVTLSACETGMGAVLSGDDVVGLTRGLLYAGAGNVLASLWPVSDAETTFLMAGFYKNLKSMPKEDALRRAQLATRARYPHPFYWSAFQLTGMGR